MTSREEFLSRIDPEHPIFEHERALECIRTPGSKPLGTITFLESGWSADILAFPVPTSMHEFWVAISHTSTPPFSAKQEEMLFAMADYDDFTIKKCFITSYRPVTDPSHPALTGELILDPSADLRPGASLEEAFSYAYVACGDAKFDRDRGVSPPTITIDFDSKSNAVLDTVYKE